MSTPASPSNDAPANPLDAVFEKAVRPFANSEALRASLPPGTPVVGLKKNEEIPTQTREFEGGGTLTIPVLGAIKDSSMGGWQHASDFEFDGLKDDAVALVVIEGKDGGLQLGVVTRAEGGAFLVADLTGMLDALSALVDNPAFRAFPGGDILIQALVSGLRAIKADLARTLRAKGADGSPSLLEQFNGAAAPSRKTRQPTARKNV